MTITTDLVLAWAAGVGTLGAVLGMLWRLTLPWIREQIRQPVADLQQPMDEIHHPVTKNHHVSDPPTLLDKFDTLHEEVRGMRRDLTQVVVWNAEEHRQLERRVAGVEGQVRLLAPRPDDT